MSSGLLASNCMLTEPGATLSQFAGEAIRCKRLPNDVVIEMEDPRCKIVAVEMDDLRCKSLLNRVALEIEDPRCNRVAIRMAVGSRGRCSGALVSMHEAIALSSTPLFTRHNSWNPVMIAPICNIRR